MTRDISKQASAAVAAPEAVAASNPETAASAPRLPRQVTIEDRLEGKARRGDRAVYAGPSLDEMSRSERHKRLYGE